MASESAIQIYDGRWYKLADYFHECCDCGLVHGVEFKLIDGVMFMRWTKSARETRKSRRLRAKAESSATRKLKPHGKQ